METIGNWNTIHKIIMETIAILSTKSSWRQLQFYPQNHHGYNWNSVYKIIMETIGILSTKLSWIQLEYYSQYHHGDNWNSIHKIIIETIRILFIKCALYLVKKNHYTISRRLIVVAEIMGYWQSIKGCIWY